MQAALSSAAACCGLCIAGSNASSSLRRVRSSRSGLGSGRPIGPSNNARPSSRNMTTKRASSAATPGCAMSRNARATMDLAIVSLTRSMSPGARPRGVRASTPAPAESPGATSPAARSSLRNLQYPPRRFGSRGGCRCGDRPRKSMTSGQRTRSAAASIPSLGSCSAVISTNGSNCDLIGRSASLFRASMACWRMAGTSSRLRATSSRGCVSVVRLQDSAISMAMRRATRNRSVLVTQGRSCSASPSWARFGVLVW
jgi:hypothetical protein